ncbi:MAG: NUDIX hydrolase [Chloroflexi bacterium]|nr:NUDIX hydrolase [Chloroflexota bacterium]
MIDYRKNSKSPMCHSPPRVAARGKLQAGNPEGTEGDVDSPVKPENDRTPIESGLFSYFVCPDAIRAWRIMELKVCAAGILFRDNKVLLGKRCSDRDFYPDTWDLPGGHCKDNETPEETLLRELKEELGITITEFNYVALLHEPKVSLYGEYYYHIYLVTNWLGAVRNLTTGEHSEIRWFEPDDALKLDLVHPDYPALFRQINT